MDLEIENQKLDQAPAEEVIRWTVDRFGQDTAISSSFGAESACLLHLATRVKPDIKVVFVDTGFLFPETHAFKEDLKKRRGR